MVNPNLKLGKAGRGEAIHVVNIFERPSDGLIIEGIYCGAMTSNGSGYGRPNRLRDFDESKVTCKKCLKRLKENL